MFYWEDLTPLHFTEKGSVRLRMLIYFNGLFNRDRDTYHHVYAYDLYHWLEQQNLA